MKKKTFSHKAWYSHQSPNGDTLNSGARNLGAEERPKEETVEEDVDVTEVGQKSALVL